MKVRKQHDSMQCGITCLQMVCRFFGREYSLDSLSKTCFATTEGVSMLGINEAARILGFQTASARATIEELNETPLPCILHWNQNHFVVLYKVKKGEKFYYIADPGKGLATYNLEEFKQHWISTNSNDEDKGIAMFFETTPAFFTYQMERRRKDRRRRVPSTSFSDMSRNTARHSPGSSRDCLRAAPCSLSCRSLPNPSWMSVSRTKTLASSGSYSWVS